VGGVSVPASNGDVARVRSAGAPTSRRPQPIVAADGVRCSPRFDPYRCRRRGARASCWTRRRLDVGSIGRPSYRHCSCLFISLFVTSRIVATTTELARPFFLRQIFSAARFEVRNLRAGGTGPRYSSPPHFTNGYWHTILGLLFVPPTCKLQTAPLQHHYSFTSVSQSNLEDFRKVFRTGLKSDAVCALLSPGHRRGLGGHFNLI
jgi:hypothetical protein